MVAKRGHPAVSIDRRGYVSEMNAAAEQLLGVKAEEAIGRSLATFLIVATTSLTSELRVAWSNAAGRPEGGGRMHTGHQQRLAERTEELAQVGGWEWHLDSGDLYWSDNHFRLFGLEPNEISPSPDFVFSQTHPDDRDAVVEWVRTAVDTGKLPVREYRIQRADGALRHLRATTTVSERRGRRVCTMVGVVQDVTDQRRAEREIAAHIAVAATLERWTSLHEGGAELLRGLGESLSLGAGALWVPSGDVLSAQVFWSAASIDSAALAAATGAVRLPRGLGLPGEAWSRARPVHVENLAASPRSLREEAALAAGFAGALAVPAVHPQHVPAVLEFYSTEPVQPSTRLIRSLVGIGYELGEFFSHRRIELSPQTITARERQVLELAALGRTGREIATELGIGPATVKTHFENLYLKLQVSDKASAVAHALRSGLIE